MEGYKDIKSSLYRHCLAIIEDRINTARLAIERAQHAANQESKSSAGDKYETGRAMMQLEKENLMFQMQESLKLKKVLHQINVAAKNENIDLGSVVKTSMGNFFIAIPAGRIKIGNSTYFTISLASPIGQALYQQKENAKITFNGKEVTIYEVW